ncbi:phosphatase PAP2 family protein [Streptomyces sp. TRM68416]|uniref:phosphatase PAP2 family protein n=1 Tax=Streptomyces sp. TRM68416 TaxID=2758412 RepID=UPI001661ED3B|nr:phosphatase PAP2 family protein [Streptomyces sp. TRM68416]MBD0839251.1 phosphatase PAP2 family protein [Streptomyces sp. TRM68416]
MDHLDHTDRHHDDLDDMDHRLLSALRAHGADPRVAAAARALSWAGEHGALWLAAGLAGAAVDGARRGAWLRATALTAGAHVVSMGVKRVVRRPRPAHVEPLVRTAGAHSFPSSHATSAVAAAVAFGTLGARAARRAPGVLDTRAAHTARITTTAAATATTTAAATATATTAATATAIAARVAPPLAAAMCLSRLVVGVHYPSDVAAGAALGALTARIGARWMTGGAHD